MISIYRDFLKKHNSFRERIETIYLWPTDRPDWEFKYLSLSLLSAVWQNWCRFCRSVIMLSCTGTVTRSGRVVRPRIGTNTWMRISYEAKQANYGNTIHPYRALNFMRQEPTWGDQNLLLRAIPVLSPCNARSLTMGFGISTYAPRHIQIVRNACFHINHESVSEVRNILTYYIGRGLCHPIDIMWWIEPSSKADAILFWLDELEIIADLVTR